MKTLSQILKEGFRYNKFGKVNAPTFSYKTVYKKNPVPPIYGKEASHETYNHNGIPIDINIPKSVIQELNNIKSIELRSSCQGDSERHLTFIVFRPLDRSEQTAKNIVNNINKNKGYIAGYDIGMEGLPRICISSNLWYSEENKTKFLNWWKNLPKVIKKSL